jgi:hypothetical protein
VTCNEIDEQYVVLKHLYEEGTMGADIFMKCVIALAYEHAILGELEDVRILVNDCTEAYLNDVMPQQMRDDPTFFRLALFVAEKLSVPGGGGARITDEEMLLAFARPGSA